MAYPGLGRGKEKYSGDGEGTNSCKFGHNRNTNEKTILAQGLAGTEESYFSTEK